MKLIEDWKQAWKWASVRCMSAGLAIQGAWMFIPEDMKDSLPKSLVSVVTITLLFLGVAARITIPREDKNGAPKEEDKSNV